MSTILSNKAIKAIERIGDIMIPKNGDFPSFSETGSIEHIDDLVAYAPEDDIKDLGTVLTILSFMPTFVLKWFVKMMNTSYESTGNVSVLLRQLDFGLRGLIFSCYYSGKMGEDFKGNNPIEIIGFSVNRISD